MMIQSTACELARVSGAQLVFDALTQLTGDIAIDSRSLNKGDIFCAFKGEVSDGNQFAADALVQGASAVVLSASAPEELILMAREKGASVLRAANDDCEEFLLRLAAERRNAHPEWLVLAVTGSVGKTTTKDMLAAAMATTAQVHATKGNYNSLIGLPLTLLSAPEDTQVLVLEMGMNHAGEIARMSRVARPALACITNIGTSHIGLLGSREGIARAKGEICEGLEAHGNIAPTLVLDAQGDFSSFIEKSIAVPKGIAVVYAGMPDQSYIWPEDVSFDEEGYAHLCMKSKDITLPQEGISLSLSIPGGAAVRDVSLAATMALLAGAEPTSALGAIAHHCSAAMRMNVGVSPSGVTVIDDSYNAAPASMASALDALASRMCTGRRIAVLGEMGEMGDEAPLYHALTGSYAAAKQPDMLICVGGELARNMADAACAMGFPLSSLMRVSDKEELIEKLPGLFEKGDCVLIKASRAAGLDVFAKEVLAR